MWKPKIYKSEYEKRKDEARNKELWRLFAMEYQALERKWKLEKYKRQQEKAKNRQKRWSFQCN